MRLKDMNLIDLMISKTVEIALEKGLIQAKNKLIQDSTHSNAMFQHISPREELIKRAKELRKAVYAVDPAMKEKMPKKNEGTGILEDTMNYCERLIDIIDKEGGFENCTEVLERMNYLKEGLAETETELEYSRDKDAKIGHKTADTSFLDIKHISP